jgi:hypothetical protein
VHKTAPTADQEVHVLIFAGQKLDGAPVSASYSGHAIGIGAPEILAGRRLSRRAA